MGAGFEVVSGRATNPGASFTALTANTGDSFTVRNASLQSGVFLENIWAFGAAAITGRLRSPRLHDNVQGVRVKAPAADSRPRLPFKFSNRLVPQDALIAEMTGGAAETDLMSWLVYYVDIPGIAARLYSWDELLPRVVEFVTVETSHSTGATVGDYGGGVALNATFDLLKANTDYALIGYLVDTACGTVGWRGPDTGNLRVGGPGINNATETREWFVWNSERDGRPYIPVINSANKAGTTVDLTHNAAGTTIIVESIFAELAPA